MIRRVIGSSSSSATRQLHAQTIKPAFAIPPHFISNDASVVSETNPSCVTRRLIFPNSKITQLKAMAAVNGVKNPTPVQVLGALIFKCATAAATGNSVRPSPLFQLLDTRPKMAARLPEACIGNLRAISEQIKKRNMEVERNEEKVEGDEVANKKMFVLRDSPSGDGIEAVVSLEERSMAAFERHQQLLQFASLQ